MTRDKAYTVIYTTILVIGMVMVNYAIPKKPEAVHYTMGGIVGFQQLP